MARVNVPLESGEGGGTEPSFEAAITRLEHLVNNLERGELSLEEALACFQEGIGLVRLCNRRLDQVEQRIKVLAEGEAGQPLWRYFPPDEKAD